MSAITDDSGQWAETRTPAVPFFWQTFAIALIGVLVIALPNLLDPMIRHDDYPAYFADPSGYWAKTLHEGRWINYLWHLREIVTPSWLNFAVYQALWATFAAAIAVSATRQQPSGWFAAVLALLIIVGPPATLISLWFNTLMPGLALVALYAVLGCVMPRRLHLALMPLFVIATFMAYTTYPLLILAVALVRGPKRSFAELFGVMSLFALSFASAVLAVYVLNYQFHGVFGVPLASWRGATPASDLAGMLANLPLVAQSMSDFLMRSSFDFPPAAVFHISLLTGATLVLGRRAPREALALHAGLWAGMALVVVQIVKMGAIVPPRGFIFAWVFYALIVTRAAQLLSEKENVPGRLARNFVLLIIGSYALQTCQQYAIYRSWQADTVALARALDDVNGPVAVTGDVLSLRSARKAGIQNARALRFRLAQLGGPQMLDCAQVSCEPATVDLTISTLSGTGIASISWRR